MKVLITGCTGYVGHQIATRLAKSGLSVIGSSRRAVSLNNVEIVTGDHLNADFVDEIVGRVDAIIHFAGRTRGHDAELFRHDNERMTYLFCTTARGYKKRFIYISSDQAVYQTGFYGKSKCACEEIVAEESDNYAILRLTAVLGRYAPYMGSTFSKTIKRLYESSFIVVPGNCDFPIAPVWIGDIEFALTKLLQEERLRNEIFEVCGQTLTLKSLIDLFEERLGVQRTRIPVPITLLQYVARLLKPYESFARLPLDALLDLGSPVRVSYDKLVNAIGFVPAKMDKAVREIEDFPAYGNLR